MSVIAKNYPKLLIKNNSILRKIQSGYMWLFANELVELPELSRGSLVDVSDKYENNLGLGFYNRNSLISVRLLNTNNFDKSEIRKRVLQAKYLRDRLLNGSVDYRLIFGESDNLPGLVVDKYGDYFSIEIYSAGMENFKEIIIEVLLEIFPTTKGIYQKNNSIWRIYELLPQESQVLFGVIPDEIEITENNVKYLISIVEGQKTGYFYDQRLNRKFLQSISNKSKVLDLFCNVGGFGLNAAYSGAEKVIGIDSQENVINQAKANAEQNKFNNIQFIKADVFDFLKAEIETFDTIICDPPAFTKSKKNVPQAIGAYFQVNRLAMKRLNKNGILLTSSCSQHITDQTFYDTIQKAAKEAKRSLRLIYTGLQSPDHPILTAMPETKYLKFYGFIVS